MTAARRTDVLLWRAKLDPAAPAPKRVSLPGGLRPTRVARNGDESLLYVYAAFDRQESLTAAELAALESSCSLDGQPVPAALCRLERVLDLRGASATQLATAHYVVETDADAGWMEEIARWYEVEHLPALAAVPGCIRATRFVNHDEGPQSLACYDLERTGVLETPSWLAVRASSWSDRVRPHFTNTRRTRFDVLTPQDQ